jgi:hypothetical protein
MNYNLFEQNQLTLKFLKKNQNTIYKKINININLYKLQNIKTKIIPESLLLLEFFCNQKSNINYYKKNFKEINIQLMANLQEKNLSYIFKILKILYLPILRRRNIKLSLLKISGLNFNYTLSSINILPFIPDIFFK